MKIANKEKKFLKIFAPLELSSQNGYAVELGKFSPQGIKFRFKKINTKLMMVSWNFDVIKELKRNFSGSHEVTCAAECSVCSTLIEL